MLYAIYAQAEVDQLQANLNELNEMLGPRIGLLLELMSSLNPRTLSRRTLEP